MRVLTDLPTLALGLVSSKTSLLSYPSVLCALISCLTVEVTATVSHLCQPSLLDPDGLTGKDNILPISTIPALNTKLGKQLTLSKHIKTEHVPNDIPRGCVSVFPSFT